MAYQFPGLWEHIAAAGAKKKCNEHFQRVRETWHFRQIDECLKLMPTLDAESRRDIYRHCIKVRASVECLLTGIDDALDEVFEMSPWPMD